MLPPCQHPQAKNGQHAFNWTTDEKGTSLRRGPCILCGAGTGKLVAKQVLGSLLGSAREGVAEQQKQLPVTGTRQDAKSP